MDFIYLNWALIVDIAIFPGCLEMLWHILSQSLSLNTFDRFNHFGRCLKCIFFKDNLFSCLLAQCIKCIRLIVLIDILNFFVFISTIECSFSWSYFFLYFFLGNFFWLLNFFEIFLFLNLFFTRFWFIILFVFFCTQNIHLGDSLLLHF